MGLGGLLQCEDGCRLIAPVLREHLRHLTGKLLERKLPDKQIRRLLVSADFSQSLDAGLRAARLLGAGVLGGCSLPSGLRLQLLALGLTAEGKSSIEVKGVGPRALNSLAVPKQDTPQTHRPIGLRGVLFVFAILASAFNKASRATSAKGKLGFAIEPPPAANSRIVLG